MMRWIVAVMALSGAPALAAPCAGFVDVDDSSPFCANVQWIKNRRVTLGCSANAFCPNDTMTRLQAAVLLNRLGDALLPPNVLWVAPSGGTFQSIQAAIDHAATIASPAKPVLVRVAPGRYAESITLKPFVEVEGASELSTVLDPRAGPLGRTAVGAAAVSMTPNSRVRRMSTYGCNTGIHFDGGNSAPGTAFVETAVRDIRILQAGTGIRIAGLVTEPPRIERVTMNLQGGANIGVLIEAALGTLAMSDVTIFVAGATSTTGIKTESGSSAALERVTIEANGPAGPNIVGIDATGFGKLSVRESSILAIRTAVQTSDSATVAIANTVMTGATVGAGISCLKVYTPTLQPVGC